MSYEINPLILDKLESLKIDDKLKDFINEVLLFEKQKMNLQGVRYKEDYERIIERYIESTGVGK